MIPKKIHYCWFGKGNKGELFEKCKKSWEKYFPDYEIIEWNEDNFDINCNKYVKEAYDKKKYAFVSDYARLKILYEEGGIYFDTDVEVLKKFDGDLLQNGYFAQENKNILNTGLGFAVHPRNKVVKIMMDDYEDLHFINEDGTMDLKTCVIRNTEALEKKGYKLSGNNPVIDGIKLYNRDFFCGFDLDNNHYIISEKTYTVHHYSGTWKNSKEQKINKLKRILSKIIGLNNYKRIRRIIKGSKKNGK